MVTPASVTRILFLSFLAAIPEVPEVQSPSQMQRSVSTNTSLESNQPGRDDEWIVDLDENNQAVGTM